MNALSKLTATILAVASFTIASPARALDKPTGDVILTVRGPDLKNANAGDTAQFDRDMLQALEKRTGAMETPWTSGKVEFSGPLLRAVLSAAGAHGQKLKIIALNDYSAEIPYEDATKLDTMLALTMNGKDMSVRDKGPLFLVYPFDLDPSLFNEKYFARSVWQIKEIEVSE
ncbi:hypothetical protein DEM27_18285 [Metarhizobium album]|uniref:Oxidoreductase molybdopterin-binding domain-containing protein n=1 Tax=Metarhizobium album TaxID=2182425 RepID=A0A2U2DNI7_9HYPH|nr:molybdopterin-dependent oxidoreductase [Rhizobium album]PWE54886.1 hypothetical protein DEM27_18285 [Rhizobium album]